MKTHILLILTIVTFFLPNTDILASDMESIPIFAQSIKKSKNRYIYTVKNGAEFFPTPDKKSYYILWIPRITEKLPKPPLIVTIHGSRSFAFDEFYLWHPFAKKYNYGIFAIQWWIDPDKGREGVYYTPHEIYRVISDVLKDLEYKPRSVLFHGFSRGSANSYAVAALDSSTGYNYFSVIISNAGGAAPDFPPNKEIESGNFGLRPFHGLHWIMYAGGKDPNPNRDGIPAMRRAKEWVRMHGGSVELFIDDTKGDHGGFHRNPKNIESALDVFHDIMEQPPMKNQ